MVAVFDFILDFIRINLIIGFGWYSIIFFTLRLFKYKKEFLTEFDKNACKTVVFLGILFFTVWLLASTHNCFFEINSEVELSKRRRLMGSYSFGLCLQVLFWLILTQLLRIRLVNRFLLFRLLIVICFFLTFERFVIVVTLFKGDYIPNSWTLYTPLGYAWWVLLLNIIGKIILFVIIAFAYKYAKQLILKFKTARVN